MTKDNEEFTLEIRLTPHEILTLKSLAQNALIKLLTKLTDRDTSSGRDLEDQITALTSSIAKLNLRDGK